MTTETAEATGLAGALQGWRERLELKSSSRRRQKPPISFVAGAAMLTAFVLVAVVGSIWTPYDPQATSVGPPFADPSAAHLFGTDRLGRDVFSQVMAATALDLGIVLVSMLLCFGLGTVIGTLAGFFRGPVDLVVTRTLEVVQSFPALLLALMVVMVTGSGFFNIVAVLVFVGTPNFVRLARAEVMSKSSMQYAEAARLAGANPFQVAFGHLVPNSLGPLVAFCSINAAWAVLIVASLGFLGVGLPPGTPEWGAIISAGQNAIMSGDWWISFFPGVAIVLLAATFYLVGDGVADLLDPRRRTS